jgi:uncharacterized protein
MVRRRARWVCLGLWTGTKPQAMVTGASTGIGVELAKVFAENGFDLLVKVEDES